MRSLAGEIDPKAKPKPGAWNVLLTRARVEISFRHCALHAVEALLARFRLGGG